MVDAAKKGRVMRGENHCMAKMTENDVKLLIGFRSNGLTYKEISIKMGIPKSTISDVLKKRTWSHVNA